MHASRLTALTLVITVALAACAPRAEPTSAQDAGVTQPTAVVDALNSALDQQMTAAAMLSNPAVRGNPAAIKLAVIGGGPVVLSIRANLEQAEAGLQGKAREMAQMALREVDAVMAIAGVIVDAPNDLVPVHHAELLAHGGAALMAINQSLHHIGAGPSAPGSAERISTNLLEVPAGYQVEVLIDDLNFATVVEVASDGTVYVGEAGFAYGGIKTPARVLRVTPDGSTEVVAEGFEGPLAGLAVGPDGSIFVSHRGTVTRVDPASGKKEDIITGLLSFGDHYNENLAVGPDGKLYVTQGTVTNSAVVGIDNYLMGWLPMNPEGHDASCRDLTLAGVNFTTGNPLTEAPADTVQTGAYLPFGTPSKPGQVVNGQTKCSGAVLRSNLDGSGLEVFSDGLRNPYGLAIDPLGRVFIAENGPDHRGSRPVYGPDNLYELVGGGWYGWPDFYGGVIVSSEERTAEGADRQRPVLSDPPSLAGRPLAHFEEHSSSNGLAIAFSGDFADAGSIFVAQLGDLSPVTTGGKEEHAGHQVVRVDFQGNVFSFLSKKGDHGEGNHAFRPTDATFDATGNVLYVTHFGVIEAVPGGIMPVPETGALLRITRSGGG